MAAETFTDTHDRVWSIRLNFGDLKRVLTLTGINLAKPGRKVTKESDLDNLTEEEMPVHLRLASDPILLMDVVYALVEPQAKEKGVSSDQFGEAISPEIFGTVSDMFWRAYQSFFLAAGDTMNAKLVEQIKKLRKEMDRQASKLDQKLDSAIARMDEEIERKIDQEIETISQ